MRQRKGCMTAGWQQTAARVHCTLRIEKWGGWKSRHAFHQPQVVLYNWGVSHALRRTVSTLTGPDFSCLKPMHILVTPVCILMIKPLKRCGVRLMCRKHQEWNWEPLTYWSAFSELCLSTCVGVWGYVFISSCLPNVPIRIGASDSLDRQFRSLYRCSADPR